jgi:hypothetical protein
VAGEDNSIGHRGHGFGGKKPKPLIYGYREAEYDAKKLLGPNAAIRYLTSKKVPRAQRHTVGVLYMENGVQLYGVIGSGTNWQRAILDAKTRIKEQEEAK